MAATNMPPRPANRLIDSTSPYLLQHAHNPVDWHPWGPEALDRARRENKPIFLSIGYAACHWCHVMEREVFENEAIARLMNERFINIKVDREERPDLDEVYMLATQVMTGSGGWPMSVWLTPELEPFYAGTYFPPVDGHGRPGFPRLTEALAEAWQTRPDELRQQAQKVVAAVRQYADESQKQQAAAQVDLPAWVRDAIEQQADRFDDEYGGFGAQPKFPPSQALMLWLELLREETPEPGHGPRWPVLLSDTQKKLVTSMLTTTLDAMMRGGIFDHVGGAFARYSTDRYWLVPHFEKMLYDNAQLAVVYAQAAVLLRRADYERVARRTLDFYLREMTAPSGGIYSTLDADSEGVEGKYYVWTRDEIEAAAGEDADLLIRHLGVTAKGNWHEGPPQGNVLHIAKSVDELAAAEPGPVEDVARRTMQKRIDQALAQLRAVRERRVRPALDDKILTGWNGLMVSALAVAGRLMHEPRYLEAAHRAIGHLLLQHMEGGRDLLRVSRAGHAHVPAFLEDHAYLLNGLMDLIDSTTPTSLPGTMARKRALELADAMVRQFEDAAHGGFFFTTAQHDALFARVKNATDNATPSANAVAIRALLRLAQVSGRERYRQTAWRGVQAFAGSAAQQPSLFSTLLQALVEDARYVAVNKHVTMAAAPTAGVAPAAHPAPSMLTLKVEGPQQVRAGGTLELAVTLRVAEGYHIQLEQPRDREAFATITRVRSSAPLAQQRWTYPDPHEIAATPTPHVGYAGTLLIRGAVTIAPNALAGEHTLRVSVLAQPCRSDFCLPPERASAELKVEIVA